MARDSRRAAKRANRPNPRADRHPRKLVDPRPDDHDNIVSLESRGRLHALKARHAHQAEEGHAKRVTLIPRSLMQENYIAALDDESQSIVFAMGPAGSGKSRLATHWAVREWQEGRASRIIITRPQVSVDEQMGFLPGTLHEKMAPWCIPIVDALKEVLPVRTVKRLIEEEVIEFAPLGFMRGRTLKDAAIIFDEAQNATPNQMKMMLTRLGEGSRMVVTGDVRQHDRGYDENGLKDFVARLRHAGSSRITVIEFTNVDIQRHPVIEEVLDLYEL